MKNKCPMFEVYKVTASSEINFEGGTQYRNIARKIGKYRNTVSKIDEVPIPPFIDPFIIGQAYLIVAFILRVYLFHASV